MDPSPRPGFRPRWTPIALALTALLLCTRPTEAGTPSPDGRWVMVTQPRSQTFGTLVLDAARRRLIEFGGETDLALNTTRVFPLDASSPAWSMLGTAPGPMPGPRLFSSAVLDPIRDRMIVHGGFVVQGSSSIVLSDTWVLDLGGTPTWSMLPTSSPGPQVYNAAAMVDPVRDRMLLFGGVGPGSSTQVWSYDLATGTGWSVLPTSGVAPSIRQAHAIVYDPVRDRMLVVGGLPSVLPAALDVYALSLSGTPTWTVLAPTGTAPAGRFGHAVAYDDAADRLLVFGGYTGAFTQDTWQLSLAGTPAWSPLSPSLKPSARFYARGAFDPVSDRFLMTGGYDGTRTLLGGVWALQPDGSTWTALAPEQLSPIPGTQGAKVLMDPLTRVLYAHTRTSLQSLPLDGPAVWSDETPAVHPLTELTGVPAQNEIAVFDEQYRRIVVGGPGGFVRITALEVDDALPRAWSQVGPEGWLMRSAAVLDASRSRILSVGPDFDTFVHTLTPTLVNFARWTIAGPRPLPRYHTSVAIDPVRDRLLVYGGYLTCSGGCDPEAPGTVHAVQLGGVESWISVPVAAGPKPAPRKHALLVHDANRDRMLMFGGSERIDDAFAMGDGLSDCWELAPGGDSLRWRQLLPDGYGPPASTYPRGFYDPVSDRLIVHAGSPTTRELLFALVFPNATTSTPPATVPGRPLQLSVGPNPSRTGLTRMQLTLPSAGPVRLEVLDLAGRCVAAMDHAGTIGTQRIEWELPGRLPAGVYHVRARQGATTDTRRWVTLR